jgi:uncharacterized SAM-binding protein YcdF (DUF218 family)
MHLWRPRIRAQAKRRGLLSGHRWAVGSLSVVFVGVACLLRLGGYLLVASDALPAHAQVAVALAGSQVGARARNAGAVSLVQHGLVDYVLLSVPAEGYWGGSVPDAARRYFENRYGNDVSKHVTFCNADDDVDSTEQEAEVLHRCLDERGWRSIIVVTSNFHTRRARLLWRRELAEAKPPFQLAVWGVADGTFEPRSWWRKRIYAKTWLLEFTKLVWAFVFRRGPG